MRCQNTYDAGEVMPVAHLKSNVNALSLVNLDCFTVIEVTPRKDVVPVGRLCRGLTAYDNENPLHHDENFLFMETNVSVIFGFLASMRPASCNVCARCPTRLSLVAPCVIMRLAWELGSCHCLSAKGWLIDTRARHAAAAQHHGAHGIGTQHTEPPFLVFHNRNTVFL
jgi:hypothetical protein